MNEGLSGNEGSPSPGANVAFFDRTFEEALQVTQDARDYLAGDRLDRADLDPDSRLVASCEEMRVTARMTQVMAWLLMQKAVHNGEVTRARAAEECRLSGQEVCLADPVDPACELPPRLCDLMRRSRQLYERVQRLDAMLDR